VNESVYSELLPEEYAALSDDQAMARCREAMERHGSDLLLLAHHYQRREIVELCHRKGDSFELARFAQRESDARWVVFCGVRFMAESAAILAAPGQAVLHPDARAGCPLADMADADDVRGAWSELCGVLGEMPGQVTPVTYINSSAELKAFCGRNRGTICTSSNAPRTFDWAMEQAKRIFFFPDQHLGRNTAAIRGIPAEHILLWAKGEPLGGNSAEAVRQARVILWDGHCHVHTWFTREQIDDVRREHPGVMVVVHPECPREVVEAADANGSTSFIIDYVQRAKPDSTIAVGTEVNLVERLARENDGVKKVIPLTRSLCPNMYRINPQNLCRTLERPESLTPVSVPAAVSRDALTALDRMLSLA
jgi:quinolinate synthase